MPPMPDEIAWSHAARFAWNHGHAIERDLAQVLAAGRQTSLRLQRPRIDALAGLGGVNRFKYASMHSLAALLDLSRSRDGNQPEVAWDDTYPRGVGRGPTAKACPECMREDVRVHGFSWYRRGPQVLGVVQCREHSVATRRLNEHRRPCPPARPRTRASRLPTAGARTMRVPTV